jgi:glycosyltransferase involved in cell wall biosynthesis
MKTYELEGKSVFIAIPAYRGVFPVETTLNLIETISKLKSMNVKVDLYVERENAIVSAARNSLLHHYLTDSTADYLFFLDDDIVFPTEDFLSVFALATEYEMVSATYPSRKDKPTFFLRNPNGDGLPFEQNEDGLIKTCGTGLGFSCIKRSIVEQIYNSADWYTDHTKGEQIKNVFRIEVKDGRFWGEDISFFQDLYNMGYINWVYPLTSLQHQGKKNYDFKLVDFMQNFVSGSATSSN